VRAYKSVAGCVVVPRRFVGRTRWRASRGAGALRCRTIGLPVATWVVKQKSTTSQSRRIRNSVYMYRSAYEATKATSLQKTPSDTIRRIFKKSIVAFAMHTMMPARPAILLAAYQAESLVRDAAVR
jgi:hypothetical protein